jgi:hypothetical protein
LNTLRGARQEPEAPVTRVRRPPAYLLVSVGLHLVLVAVLLRYVVTPNAFLTVFGGRKSVPVPAERIGFLVLPKATGTPIIGKSGGDNRPAIKGPPVKLVAPTTVPSALPPVAAPAKATEEEGSGPLVGTGGPARGIRPTYTDPRLWPTPGDVVAAPKTATQRLDSVIADLIGPYNDSMAVAAGKRKPGDWTFERDGKKYGIDPQMIHLGKFSIPTALLGLLPLNLQANPVLAERNKASLQLNSDIRSQAQRGMNEADFKKAVRSIRERKEREKAAAASEAGNADNKKRPTDSPPAAQTTPERG